MPSYQIKKNPKREENYRRAAALLCPGQKRPLAKVLDEAVAVFLRLHEKRNAFIHSDIDAFYVVGPTLFSLWKEEARNKDAGYKAF